MSHHQHSVVVLQRRDVEQSNNWRHNPSQQCVIVRNVTVYNGGRGRFASTLTEQGVADLSRMLVIFVIDSVVFAARIFQQDIISFTYTNLTK